MAHVIRNLVQARRRLWEHLRYEARLHPDQPAAETAEERFLDNVRRTIEAHLEDESFDVESLALSLGYSRASLYRRLEGLVEDSPAEIIVGVRLERASQLLENVRPNRSPRSPTASDSRACHTSVAVSSGVSAVSPSEYRSTAAT